MKGLTQHILEKLKVTTTPSNINDKQFFDTVFNYCKRNDCLEITALDIYKEFKNIPKERIDTTGNRSRINFALRPTGDNSVVNIEVWEYDLENKAVGMISNRKANEYTFDFLKTKLFDEEIISDIYNYCA